jgi:GDP-L-fucose synthase
MKEMGAGVTERKKVLVTGSGGVLGEGLKAIADSIKECVFVFTTSKNLNLLRFDETVDFVRNLKPDYILHLAAVSGGVNLSINYPATLLRDNVMMNFNILEAARLCGVEKIVMTLSSGMYPEEASIPISESSIHMGAPHYSNYSYAYAKRLIEPSIAAYRKEYDMNVIGLVPNGIFGEHADFTNEGSAMWAALIRRFYENISTNENIVIWGNGTQLREHTYSQDMAKAFVWCMLNYNDEKIINVGSTEELSVKEISFLIAEYLNVDKTRIIFDDTKPKGIHRKGFDNSRFLKKSNFKFSPFNDGLKKTIKWFVESYRIDGVVKL